MQPLPVAHLAQQTGWLGDVEYAGEIAYGYSLDNEGKVVAEKRDDSKERYAVLAYEFYKRKRVVLHYTKKSTKGRNGHAPIMRRR